MRFIPAIRIYSIFLAFCSFLYCFGQKGFFINPVVDLLLKPALSRATSEKAITDIYNSMAYSPEKGPYACRRAHQGLFNEEVEVLQEMGCEIQVKIKHCFYDCALSLEQQNTFWTLRNNIITEAELGRQQIPLTIFPPAEKVFDESFAQNFISLWYPWHDLISHVTYSAGTRFIRAPFADCQHGFGVILYDKNIKSLKVRIIPADKTFICPENYSFEMRSHNFVHLLNDWIDYTRDYTIPYTWGGVSFVGLVRDCFLLKEQEIYDQENSFWVREDCHNPCAGFDCSGLILRAAQLVGIPFFFKNTTTIFHHAKCLSQSDILREGDLIWTPGHIMVVSNIENNEVIESIGYGSGYGKLIRLTLAERFVGISTYQELIQAYHTQQEIYSRYRDGQISDKPKKYFLLTLKSVFCN